MIDDDIEPPNINPRTGEIKRRGEHRISKSNKNELVKIFFQVLGTAKFITREKRREIRNAWKKEYPLIPDQSIASIYAYNLENDYYSDVESYNSKALTGKITKQLTDLQEDLQDASTKDEILKAAHKLNSITKSSEVIAKVNRLYDAAPQASILINTSVNEQELLSTLNALHFQKIDTTKENTIADNSSKSTDTNQSN